MQINQLLITLAALIVAATEAKNEMTVKNEILPETRDNLNRALRGTAAALDTTKHHKHKPTPPKPPKPTHAPTTDTITLTPGHCIDLTTMNLPASGTAEIDYPNCVKVFFTAPNTGEENGKIVITSVSNEKLGSVDFYGAAPLLISNLGGGRYKITQETPELGGIDITITSIDPSVIIPNNLSDGKQFTCPVAPAPAAADMATRLDQNKYFDIQTTAANRTTAGNKRHP